LFILSGWQADPMSLDLERTLSYTIYDVTTRIETEAKEQLSIREAADRAEVSPHTLRYYERAGLIPPIERLPSGHRRYSEQDLRWVTFVRKLRRAGFPISKIRRYVILQRQGEETLPERFDLLTEHRDALRGQIEELTITLEYLEAKLRYYANVIAGRADDCV
jgi:DNA-binding transcriptional MerR regulator